MDLEGYYTTPHWIAKSRLHRRKHPFCQRKCGRKSEHTHHLRYWRYAFSILALLRLDWPIVKKPIFFHERSWHLQAVCIICHKDIHNN